MAILKPGAAVQAQCLCQSLRPWPSDARRGVCDDARPQLLDWVKQSGRTGRSQQALLRAQAIADADERAEALGNAGKMSAMERAVTGRLKQAPVMQPAEEMFNSAAKLVRRVQPRDDVRKETERAANKAARALDVLMKELTGKVSGYRRAFPDFAALHPFEQSMLDLSIGAANYDRILRSGDELKREIGQIAKGYATKASRAASAKEAESLEAAGVEAVRAFLLGRGKYLLSQMKEAARTMRAVPAIDLLVPTLALVGAPNVGKSSLVNVLSSGTPEVCNYPFTTRSIKMGHFFVNQIRHQVTDTPGLLFRPDEERNAMEKLTMATLEWLPTAAVFVMDLTEECGCSVQQQWQLRRELLQRFPLKLWIDVFSKSDLLEEELDAADCAGASSPPHADAVPRDAVEMIQWLPHTLRVSAVTEQGLSSLKLAVLDLMKATDWAAQIQHMQAHDTLALRDPPALMGIEAAEHLQQVLAEAAPRLQQAPQGRLRQGGEQEP